MNLRLLAVLVAVAACTPLPTHRPFETPKVVEGLAEYTDAHHVPAPVQHLVEWHTGGPVVLLYAERGTRACAITPVQAAYAVPYRPFRCWWRAVR